MKLLLACLVLVFMTNFGIAQDSRSYLSNFYNKIYSIKSKGVQDLVVDVTSSQLSEDLNTQKIFGNVKALTFRVYWTANPEKIAVEVLGLPEGFREVKESLKISFSRILEDLIPINFDSKFSGYKSSTNTSPNTKELVDSTGINPIPKLFFVFDTNENLTEIKAGKPVGEYVIYPKYKKMSFSDGKWVLESQKMMNSENGVKIELEKDYEYSEVKGIGVIDQISVEAKTIVLGQNAKEIKTKDKIIFNNYKLNQGEALKYFLSEKSSN